MIFAISDIHGHYDLLEKRVGQIKPFLKEENNKLIFLGDYIDRGDKRNSHMRISLAVNVSFIIPHSVSFDKRNRLIFRVNLHEAVLQ